MKDIGLYGVGKPSGEKSNNVADDIVVNYKTIYAKGNN